MLNKPSAGGNSSSEASGGLDDDSIEYVLLNKPECYVYNVPPSTRGRGHKAGEWTNCIWRGPTAGGCQGERGPSGRREGEGKVFALFRAQYLSLSSLTLVPGDLFAACPIAPDTPIDRVVERTVDSSRYFVLRLSDGSGHHAYLGVGFEDRNDAFDFNACLYDFDRQRSQMGSSSVPTPGAAGQKDLINPLREKARKGEGKVTLRLKGLSAAHKQDGHELTGAPSVTTTAAQPTDSSTAATDGSVGPDAGGFLPPPPMAGRSRHGGGRSRRGKAPSSTASTGPTQVSTVNDLIDFDASVSGESPEAQQAASSVPGYPGVPVAQAQPYPYGQPVPGYTNFQPQMAPYPYGVGQQQPEVPPMVYQGQYPPMQGTAVSGPQSAAPQVAMPPQPYSVPASQPTQLDERAPGVPPGGVAPVQAAPAPGVPVGEVLGAPDVYVPLPEPATGAATGKEDSQAVPDQEVAGHPPAQPDGGGHAEHVPTAASPGQPQSTAANDQHERVEEPAKAPQSDGVEDAQLALANQDERDKPEYSPQLPPDREPQ
ncbi:hypothetical protein FOZ60_003031 [Perkinsus olseni]|uniref:NECAP PHear domain-containing protein n=1 Tax=Perkinsus olseni TaxID=32597 RepID=A0A7J6PI37_PEROL|nr:hypothetical protein FOZ60_003031 [Perkinsus olseni]